MTGLIQFKETGTILTGIMEVEQTLEGLRLYNAEVNEYGGWQRLPGEGIRLIESNPDLSRFNCATSLLFHRNELFNYDKSLLRYMRNTILANHQYVFQSPDLKEYFEKEPWYHHGDDNDNVKLSFIEILNIGLIQCIEATPDGE